MRRKQRSDGLETRRQLLAAACEVFGKKGFRDATIAEICAMARANVAAANYHFGGKEALYVESWRYAFDKSLKAYPPDGGVAPDSPVEERLRGQVLSIMRRILDPESHDLDMVHKEMANPTGLLAAVIKESLEPVFLGLTAIVRELLGAEATEQEIQLCQMSIRAQCFGPLLRERMRKKSPLGQGPAGSEPFLGDVETLANHVTRFSLAGMRELRERIVKRPGFIGEDPCEGAKPVFVRGQQ